MTTISVKLPEDLKAKAVLLAQRKKMSLGELVKYSLHTAVVQEETMAWMKSRLRGKNPELLVAEFGHFLEKTKPGPEPTSEEIQSALRE